MHNGAKQINLPLEMFTILRPYLLLTVVATGFGIAGGLATTWLLATINSALHSPTGMSGSILVRFSLLCVLSISGTAIAGVANSAVGQKVVASLRKSVSLRIIKAPLDVIERTKPHKLLAILTNDIDTISVFTFNFAGYAVSIAIIAGSLFYLASLSLVAFFIFLVSIAVGLGIGAYAKRGWARDYQGVREAQDKLQEQYRAITEGAKEIRLNAERRDHVYGTHLAGSADRISDLKISAMRRYWVVDSVGSGLLLATIGVFLGIQASLGMTSVSASGAILVMLYIRAPIEQLINSVPAFFQARIAFHRVAEISSGLIAIDEKSLGTVRDHQEVFSGIELVDATYCFGGADGRPGFVLGPINLRIKAGETLFVVGENGSGKTTLMKMLLGLYVPSSGQLLVDGIPVGEELRAEYRSKFSAVFSDYYLFSDLLGDEASIDESAVKYLEDFEISHKVDVRDGAFSTIDLSTGQRKRLALIHAYLERRPIMMFDEWAADQDPTFRRVFYDRILPDLAGQKKTLIVVSHDDRFFEAADRVITLREGRVISDEPGRAAGSVPHLVRG